MIGVIQSLLPLTSHDAESDICHSVIVASLLTYPDSMRQETALPASASTQVTLDMLPDTYI